MKKFDHRFLIWFLLVAVVIFGIGAWLRATKVVAPDTADSGDGSAQGSVSVDVGSGTVAVIGESDLGDTDDITIKDEADGYYFSMPANWYAEKNASTVLTVYPDYDPKSGLPPECKIEISSFAAQTGANISDWITRYLHADPTASISEISRAPIAIDIASGIEWHGLLNDVTTTLVYAQAPAGTGNAAGKIFEMAPSTLSEASDADNDDCDLDLQALVANFHFGTYEP